ncbi:MAG: dTMP kinase [Candidatus Babeliales bacterium]
MPVLERGIIIALEGIDGSGKTVLANSIFKALATESFSVLLTKEPGGSEIGKKIREMLQHQNLPIVPKAEYLLFAADRAQHFTEVIIPELARNKIIISDRLADSSVVYQGYAQDLDINMIKQINHWAMDGIEPDIVFYVEIEGLIAQKRREQRGAMSEFDKKSEMFFKKLIAGYETEFKNRNNVITLDGNKPTAILTQQAIDYIHSWIIKKNLLQ